MFPEGTAHSQWTVAGRGPYGRPNGPGCVVQDVVVEER